MSQPPTPPEPSTKPLPQPQPQQGMQQQWPKQEMPPGGPWPQYRPVPAQQPPKKVKRFGWPTVIITAVISLFVGMLFAFAGEPTTAVPEATATVPETENLPAEESSEPKTQEQDQPKAADTISDGTHEVGVDIKPGQYKTSVPEGELCFWERSRANSDDSTTVLQEGPARQSVTIKKGELFETEDWGTWKRV
jgi:cytoskeletal protein RodZ